MRKVAHTNVCSSLLLCKVQWTHWERFQTTRSSSASWPKDLVENEIFALIGTNKVVKFDSKRLRLWITACKASILSGNILSTIDLLAAHSKDPFIVVVSSDAKQRLNTELSPLAGAIGKKDSISSAFSIAKGFSIR